MPTSLWWNHLSDHPLVQWGITRGALQEASLPKGAIKKKGNCIGIGVDMGTHQQGYQKLYKETPSMCGYWWWTFMYRFIYKG